MFFNFLMSNLALTDKNRERKRERIERIVSISLVLLERHHVSCYINFVLLIKFMRTIDKYYNQNDEYIHPFWLGILILLSVMTIIGTLCCLRVRFGEQLRYLCNKLFGRDTQSNGNNRNRFI